MQATGDGPGGAAGGAEGQGGPISPDGEGSPGGPDGEGSHGGPDGRGGPGAVCGAGAAVVGLPGILDVPRAPPEGRRGGKRAPAAGWPGNQLHEFTLRVPFLSAYEAEVACRSLRVYDKSQLPALQQERTVDGSVLVVKWTSPDPGVLRASVISFLDLLSLAVRIVKAFGPQFIPKRLQERWH
ncbi:PREDICTED: EKC/KEOPS complex subunit LAGE3-like [Galeopterus variegatus]|uniref:EKC/KEOPS complex subunit LAGE3-like n=1 Tax=Galeopterus variegatus TaxID=482537 RepID=A0ABM0Q2J1_GALVR|nr:PREDICTED: EKC/KEOPS complex subunit LAGE3-like [Galeopterus variegatus]